MKRNIHPADELHEVRAQIRELEERESELRQMFLDEKCGLRGNEFRVEIKKQDRHSYDIKAIVQKMGASNLRPFQKTTVATYVNVLPLWA